MINKLENDPIWPPARLKAKTKINKYAGPKDK